MAASADGKLLKVAVAMAVGEALIATDGPLKSVGGCDSGRWQQ